MLGRAASQQVFIRTSPSVVSFFPFPLPPPFLLSHLYARVCVCVSVCVYEATLPLLPPPPASPSRLPLHPQLRFSGRFSEMIFPRGATCAEDASGAFLQSCIPTMQTRYEGSSRDPWLRLPRSAHLTPALARGSDVTRGSFSTISVRLKSLTASSGPDCCP